MLASVSTSLPFAPSETVSWIHIGDTHLTRSGEQNEIDLGRIVDEINAIYAKGGIDFVFVPGDIADKGRAGEYELFRKHMDRLQLPWCAIVGDHDVHENRFVNFNRFVDSELYASFSVGPYRFFRLNAFSVPSPDSFVLDDEQLRWLEAQLKETVAADQSAILMLHCYPSDLKHGARKLRELLNQYPVFLVDMGHTHYNELSNDGQTLFSATRSTGQIEEGPVGYSVITVDAKTVSWHFVPLGSPSLVAITRPADERLRVDRAGAPLNASLIEVHAKTWSLDAVTSVVAEMDGSSTELTSIDGVFWKGLLRQNDLDDGRRTLKVQVTTDRNHRIGSNIEIVLGKPPERSFAAIDQDNAIGVWLERGLLGTQLGPNKNGKKW